MPTYEFRCEAGHTTDRFFRSMSAALAVIECPQCAMPAVRQVSGGIGLVFKGSGFYITDYGKDGKKPQTEAKPEGSSTGGTSKSDTGESSATTKGGSTKVEGGSSGSSGSDK